ncbi:DUF2620 domain-containing protein (plasmid) [Entomospira entomophila]|uniref:DUF2620 domain-containing protein n=1 Tax=Entomospira entomophila TaxID=2719988 RepID=A0A968GA36_9SPIO|nr:DUF2620 domain-containing protein [Entomospira entomophilus]NIZ41307.1 DUF2620 domain-containing protein [Entomospira entomophilus]WDI36170.1 DUF2620 domain-containing protein [Entomospira entomophilus]
MKRIVVGGQIDKDSLAELIQSCAKGAFTIEIKSDLEAAMAVQANQADYYFGACNTGGGGALAMAIALLGKDKCATISMPGKIMSEAEMLAEIQAGKIAFGFTAQDKEKVVPFLISRLQEQ